MVDAGGEGERGVALVDLGLLREQGCGDGGVGGLGSELEVGGEVEEVLLEAGVEEGPVFAEGAAFRGAEDALEVIERVAEGVGGGEAGGAGGVEGLAAGAVGAFLGGDVDEAGVGGADLGADAGGDDFELANDGLGEEKAGVGCAAQAAEEGAVEAGAVDYGGQRGAALAGDGDAGALLVFVGVFGEEVELGHVAVAVGQVGDDGSGEEGGDLGIGLIDGGRGGVALGGAALRGDGGSGADAGKIEFEVELGAGAYGDGEADGSAQGEAVEGSFYGVGSGDQAGYAEVPAGIGSGGAKGGLVGAVEGDFAVGDGMVLGVKGGAGDGAGIGLGVKGGRQADGSGEGEPV